MKLVADILSMFGVVYTDYLQIHMPQYVKLNFIYNLFLKYKRAMFNMSHSYLDVSGYLCNSQQAQIRGVMHYAKCACM